MTERVNQSEATRRQQREDAQPASPDVVNMLDGAPSDLIEHLRNTLQGGGQVVMRVRQVDLDAAKEATADPGFEMPAPSTKH